MEYFLHELPPDLGLWNTMPVYIRKNVSYTPLSLDKMELEDDKDFLMDPEQLWDTLPQPYRMINKILTQLIDSAWEIIDDKDRSHADEAFKINAPKYDDPVKLQVQLVFVCVP